MFTIISMAIAIAVAAIGYLQAKSFVQSKLRFVDAVHHFAVPLLAGLAAILVATPVVWLLPLIGKGTAILFGIGVGAGVSSGARDIRKRIGGGTI
jgi:UDP-N-acetylmuramyl pentapeptide phosphotransferase/UDP-N-acetylglucosamine-1-phosphate transferase